MVTAKDVSHAWTRIKPHVLRTPVLETDVFGMPLTLKLHVLNCDALVYQRLLKHSALFYRHDRVVGAVHEKKWSLYRRCSTDH